MPDDQYPDEWYTFEELENELVRRDAETAFWEMAAELEVTDDPYARNALFTGWYDLDIDSNTRMDARALFIEYMGEDWFEEEFDWDEWRDWYEAA